MDYLTYNQVDYNELKPSSKNNSLMVIPTDTSLSNLTYMADIYLVLQLLFLVIVPIALLFISHHIYQVYKELKNANSIRNQFRPDRPPEKEE